MDTNEPKEPGNVPEVKTEKPPAKKRAPAKKVAKRKPGQAADNGQPDHRFIDPMVKQKKVIKRRPRAGRPSTFTDEIGQEIIDRLSNGERITHICADPKMPNYSTICDWEDATDEVNGVNILRHPKFAVGLARARIRNSEIRLFMAADKLDEAAEPIFQPRTGKPIKDRETGKILCRLTREAIAKATSQINFEQWVAERVNNRYKTRQAIETTGPDGKPIAVMHANLNFDQGVLEDAFKSLLGKGV